MSRVGRPRLVDRKRQGDTAHEEILDAAAELFSNRGFTATSTRTIAEAVGIRQASLYHHFPTKESILVQLLQRTITPTLERAKALAELDISPSVRLWVLCAVDAQLLIEDRFNVARLYNSPELAAVTFADINERRRLLFNMYTQMTRAAIAHQHSENSFVLEVPFRIVESIIASRSDPYSVFSDTADQSNPPDETKVSVANEHNAATEQATDQRAEAGEDIDAIDAPILDSRTIELAGICLASCGLEVDDTTVNSGCALALRLLRSF